MTQHDSTTASHTEQHHIPGTALRRFIWLSTLVFTRAGLPHPCVVFLYRSFFSSLCRFYYLWVLAFSCTPYSLLTLEQVTTFFYLSPLFFPLTHLTLANPITFFIRQSYWHPTSTSRTASWAALLPLFIFFYFFTSSNTYIQAVNILPIT